MIEKEYGRFILYCDVCGEAVGESGEFDDFYGAVEYKAKSGWKSEKRSVAPREKGYKVGWFDICPDCQ